MWAACPMAGAVRDAIEIKGLVKTFGTTRALDGLDLQVATGEVHGFLGPNGAGKSTTIRILLGLLRADSGEMRLLGGDPWSDAVELHRRLAYVPGDVALWPNLTGGEVIDILGRLRGGIDRARRDELLERFELDPTKKGRAYSKGNRQKVALVAALASDVELLLLDEPTAGLDPLMEAVFQEVIRERTDDGRTVLLSSHILAEVEALCDRVSIIRLGRTVETGTLAELRHLTRTAVTVETTLPIDGLSDLPGVHDAIVEGVRARFDVDTARLEDALRHLLPFGIRSLTSQPPTLEELFLRHYGDELAVGEDQATAGAMSRRPTTTGVLPLVRLVLRRDRVRLPIWIVSITLLVLFTAASVKGLYKTEAELVAGAAPMYGNAAVIALNGPTYAIDTYGGQMVFQVGSFGYVVVALMGMFLVGRHTRADEEDGRTELIRATVVGRNAPGHRRAGRRRAGVHPARRRSSRSRC